MERASFIIHKGKEIYFIDYTNIKLEDEFLDAIKSTNLFREKVKASGKKDLLMLVDISNSYVYGHAFTEMKRSGILTQGITKRTAVVGVSSTKKTLLEIMNAFTSLNIKSFESIDEAKNWLVR
jgi:hypothetical protein